MNNSHLVVILRSLSKKEVRELRKWLQSPVHNQREDVMNLFEYLINSKRLEKSNLLQKEKVFRKIFPGEIYDDAKLRQSMYFLLKAVEEFLVYSEMEEDKVRQRTVLASVYRKRKLDKAFQRTFRQIEALQAQTNFQDESHLRNEYLLQREEYLFWEDRRQYARMNVQGVSDALDYTFLADKLRQSCLILAYQNYYKSELNIGLIDEVLDYIAVKEIFHIPSIAIYYHVYQAFSSDDSEIHFRNLRAAISQYGHLFPHREIRDIYLMAINYCIRKINQGERLFIQESFNMYKAGFEKKYLIENNQISNFTFMNAVASSLGLNEYGWTNHFIEHYQQFLEPKHRSNTVDYCQARLYFEQKEYGKAMRLLAQVEFNEVIINIRAKAMLLKMYYELSEDDALDALLESMRTYINRKKILGYHKTTFTNLIRLTKKLIRINPFDAKQREKLRTEILSTNPLTEREWLLEQLNEL